MLHCEEHPAMTIDKKMQLDAVNDCALITWRILVTRDQATKKSIGCHLGIVTGSNENGVAQIGDAHLA